MEGPRAGQGAGELASGPDVQQRPVWLKVSAGRLALAALPSFSRGGGGWEAGPTPLPGSVCSSLAAGASCWVPRASSAPLPCAGGARPSGPPRRWASAVCPLLCTSDIAHLHVGLPPHAGLVSPHGCMCFCGRQRVTRFPVSTLALASSLSAPWGPSWSSGAPWRPSLQYPAVSASRLRL